MILDSRILWSLLKTQSVTVSVTRRPKKTFLLFQAQQIIDIGRSNQRVFLKGLTSHQAPVAAGRTTLKKSKPALPSKLGRLDISYAGPEAAPLADVYETIVGLKGKSCIEKIVPDVLAPGDFVLFKIGPDRQVRFVEALRAMTVKQLMNYKPTRISHAL